MVQNLSPVHQTRLNAALDKIGGVSDKLGLGIDPGIRTAVAMLNHHGIHTVMSCEGHENWATGGPYIDIAAAGSHDNRKKLEEITNREEQESFWKAMYRETTDAGKKIVPILDEFYKGRDTAFSARLILVANRDSMRLESAGVAFLYYETDPSVKNKDLKLFQSEMNDFSDFLVTYEPAVSLKATEKITQPGSSIGKFLMGILKDTAKPSTPISSANRL